MSLPSLAGLSIGAPTSQKSGKRDNRGRELGDGIESFEILRTEHSTHTPPFRVSAMIQSTPLVSATATARGKDRGTRRSEGRSLSSGNRTPWTHIHIDELVLHPEYRRGGVGTWLMGKWLSTEQAFAEEGEVTLQPRISDVLNASALTRSGFRADGVLEPFVTLCVDEENGGARAFYMRLGFVEVKGDAENCPGRIQCMTFLKTLAARLARLHADSTTGTVPKPLKDKQRVRIAFTGPELESLTMQNVARGVGYLGFSTEHFEKKLALNDPAVSIAKMISDFYETEFRKVIEHAVANQGAALFPIGKANGIDATTGHVTKAVVDLYALDRLFMWNEYRVLLDEAAFKALRENDVTRTDLEQWESTRFTMLFDRPE